jgi:hypothetical protein
MVEVYEGKVPAEDVPDLLAEWGSFIKLAVDVAAHVIAAGGEMHADCELALLDRGSAQEDIWGADWIPAEREVRFESLINIRPAQGNRSTVIRDSALRAAVEQIVRDAFE